MDRQEFDKLDRVEDRMWWFAALHANLADLCHRGSQAHQPLLDAGCGTGGFLAGLARRWPDRALFGVDADAAAAARARSKTDRPICAGSINDLPFADGAFGMIVSADVLCHAGVDEARALAQFNRCLAADGSLLLNLPAYRWMLSRHDRAVDNLRRYTRTGVASLLRNAGFEPVYLGYWNAVLFPLMVLSRKLLAGDADAASDVRLYPTPVEALCRAATATERGLMRMGLRLPFGGSVLALAIKR